MAKSTEITAVDASLVNPTVYMGNVQAITVTIADADNGTYDISKQLPDNCRVVKSEVYVADLGTAFTAQLGWSADPDGIAAMASGDVAGTLNFPIAGSAAGYVDVSDKTLQIVVAGADNTADIVGHVLVVTNQ